MTQARNYAECQFSNIICTTARRKRCDMLNRCDTFILVQPVPFYTSVRDLRRMLSGTVTFLLKSIINVLGSTLGQAKIYFFYILRYKNLRSWL